MAEETKISKAQQKAVNKYVQKNYDRINVTFPKGFKAEIKAHAEAQGESMNAFIIRAVNEAMNCDGRSSESPILDSPIEPEPSASTQINTTESTGQSAETKQNTQTVISEDLKELLQGKEELVDLDRLLSDMIYQFDVLKAFGSDALARLLEKARRQTSPPDLSAM